MLLMYIYTYYHLHPGLQPYSYNYQKYIYEATQ